MFWSKKKNNNEEISEIISRSLANHKQETIDIVNEVLTKRLANKESVEDLETKIANLKKELEELHFEAKELESDNKYIKKHAVKEKELEKLEWEHLVKMHEEKNEISYEKKLAVIEKENQEKITGLLNEKHSEILKTIESYKNEMTKVLTTVITAIPNVNMEIIKEIDVKTKPQPEEDK